MKQVASLRYGVIFKKAFSQPDIFQAFASDILGIKLQIDHVETEKSFDKPIGNVDTKFDLFAEDKVNRVIVDIQHQRTPDHYHRFLHYHCAALLEQSVSSQNYKPLLAVYTIVLLTSGDKHKRDMSMIDFDPKDRDGKPLGEIPHKIIYLCPKYLDEKTPKPWQEWLQAIDDSLDEQIDESRYKNDCVRKVLDIIELEDITPQERAEMKDQYSRELLAQENEEKYLKEKQRADEEKAKREALEKEQQQQLLKMARDLLTQGLTIEVVSQVTKLPLEQVKSFVEDNEP